MKNDVSGNPLPIRCPIQKNSTSETYLTDFIREGRNCHLCKTQLIQFRILRPKTRLRHIAKRSRMYETKKKSHEHKSPTQALSSSRIVNAVSTCGEALCKAEDIFLDRKKQPKPWKRGEKKILLMWKRLNYVLNTPMNAKSCKLRNVFVHVSRIPTPKTRAGLKKIRNERKVIWARVYTGTVQFRRIPWVDLKEG